MRRTDPSVARCAGIRRRFVTGPPTARWSPRILVSEQEESAETGDDRRGWCEETGGDGRDGEDSGDSDDSQRMTAQNRTYIDIG